VQRVVWALVAFLIAKRIAYHLSYIVFDPFALGTLSDGQLYELAARDILEHPPLGTLPLYLQGLYAYLLALSMSVVPQVVMGLLVQLIIAAGALFLFQRAARTVFGSVFGGLSLCVLLACPEPAFYENKYLSVSLGIATNIFAIYTAVRAFERLSFRDVLLAGVALGLSLLGRPNLVLAVPFTMLAFMVLARGAGRPLRDVLVPLALGVVLTVAPMALRNQIVIGSPDVFPSHGGGIPLYIGNNPYASGGWNSAGGLLSGMVYMETTDIARKLGITAKTQTELDAKVGDALFHKAIDFITEKPGRFVELCGIKLWRMIGNHRFVRDYDIRGESELIGSYHQWGLPFGVVLGIGALGFFVLARRAQVVRAERARLVALLLVLGGQVVAVAIANMLVFTSAQNRVPLVVPLAFVAGPAIEALYAKIKRRIGAADYVAAGPSRFEAGSIALAVAVLLAMQAFWPRLPDPGRPSSAHYYNLGAVEEQLDRLEDAEVHFRRAKEQNRRQPMFWLAHGRVLRRLGRFDEALVSLTHIITMPEVSDDLHKLAHAERMYAAAKLTELVPPNPVPSGSR
jgi:hypothetical protein